MLNKWSVMLSRWSTLMNQAVNNGEYWPIVVVNRGKWFVIVDHGHRWAANSWGRVVEVDGSWWITRDDQAVHRG